MVEILEAVNHSEGWLDEAILMTKYDGEDALDYPENHYLVVLRELLCQLKDQFSVLRDKYPQGFLDACEAEERLAEEFEGAGY